MVAKKERALAWIDLEMTGLRPERDKILEIASIVTDGELNLVAEGPSLVIHHPQHCLQDMSDWVLQQHTRSGLLDEVRESKIYTEDAEQATLDFLCAHCLPGIAPLCGNSVWQDRAFLVGAMPRVVAYLHYRLIDVTAFKEVIRRWYPRNPQSDFKKRDAHRAYDDIKESVAELRYYRDHFFISQGREDLVL